MKVKLLSFNLLKIACINRFNVEQSVILIEMLLIFVDISHEEMNQVYTLN